MITVFESRVFSDLVRLWLRQAGRELVDGVDGCPLHGTPGILGVIIIPDVHTALHTLLICGRRCKQHGCTQVTQGQICREPACWCQLQLKDTKNLISQVLLNNGKHKLCFSQHQNI